MSFVSSSVVRLPSPHKDEISDVCIHSKTNQIAFLSSSMISLWSSLDTPKLSWQLGQPGKFIKCTFIDESTLAILAFPNPKIMQYRIFTCDLRTSKFTSTLEIPKLSNVVFFKRVAKHIFALDTTGTIIYATLDLSRFQSRKVTLDSEVVSARASGDSLFILLKSGQIGVMCMNDLEYLVLPTCDAFVVDHSGEFIQIRVHEDEWQLWSLKPLAFISKMSLSSSFGVWSPVRQTCVFFTGGQFSVAYYSDILETHTVTSVGAVSCAIFDSFGQVLFCSVGFELFYIGFATSSSVYSPNFSAPLTSTSVLLPFKGELRPVPLPRGVRGKMSMFGESALAVASSSEIWILPFREKISPSVLDGSAHAQFIKNEAIADEENRGKWFRMEGYIVRDLAWYNRTLIALCIDKTYVIQGITLSAAGDSVVTFSRPVKGKPRSVSLYGNKLMVAFSSCLSFYSLDNGMKLISRSSFGEIGIKRAVFLNSETAAVHTNDRRLMLVFHTKVLHVIEDVIEFQLTGSSAWPVLLYGSKRRLLGVNNAELVLDEQFNKILAIGVDGFSLLSLAPCVVLDFVHLVVFQALSTDSLASAVSVLSQSSEDRKLEILSKVGVLAAQSCFRKFMGLLDRFGDIEDRVLSVVFRTTSVATDYSEFWRVCFAHGWYMTASELLSGVDCASSVDLLIKSGFDISVVKKVSERFPELFDRKTDVAIDDVLISTLESELDSFYRTKFGQNELTVVSNLLPYFEDGMKLFLMRNRRERERSITKFSPVIKAMRKCSRQQLIELSLTFEEVFCLDLVFCCAFCLNDFSKCIECLEKQPRIMKCVDEKMLDAIGYHLK